MRRQAIHADVIAVSNSTEIELSFLKARHEELDPDFECQGAVLYISDSYGVYVYDSEFSGSGAMGIAMDLSDTIYIEGCYLHQNSYCALYINNSGDIDITGCTITDNASLMDAYDIGSINMSGNTIMNNGTGGY